MKIAVLADIHNNVVALNAVLDALQNEKCDKILCAGDIIGIGPYPEETVKKVMSIPNFVAVKGNHEKYLTDGMPTECPNDEGMDFEEMCYHHWEHKFLSPESILFLKNLPFQVEFSVYNKKISLMHYCMDKDNRYINYTSKPTGEDLEKMFSDKQQDIIVYGHDHDRTICTAGGKWYINSGSLGCPGKGKNLARSAILEIAEKGDIAVRTIDVEYDVDKVVADINRMEYPAYKMIKKFFYGIDET